MTGQFPRAACRRFPIRPPPSSRACRWNHWASGENDLWREERRRSGSVRSWDQFERVQTTPRIGHPPDWNVPSCRSPSYDLGSDPFIENLEDSVGEGVIVDMRVDLGHLDAIFRRGSHLVQEGRETLGVVGWLSFTVPFLDAEVRKNEMDPLPAPIGRRFRGRSGDALPG